MSDKAGRNEPCPCGSGKKYKKCCGFNKVPDFSLPEDMRTGTILDEYMMLFQGIGIFGQSLKQFDEARRVLNEAVKDFKRRFRPGKQGGVSDGVFMTWQYLDFRFGKTNETICERFIKAGYLEKLRDPGPALIKNMSQSYLTFYEMKSVSDDWLIFEEIGTGQEWRTHRINEPFEREARTGDVWYVRFLGVPEDGYIYTAPYIFLSEDASHFKFFEAMVTQKNVFARYTKKGLTEDEIFQRSCKESVRFWLESILRDNVGCKLEPIKKTMPLSSNTDGEPIRFSKIYFKIKQTEGLSGILSSLSNINYDAESKIWVWRKKGNRRIEMLPNTILGSLKIEGGYLIAETNSLSRALKLKNKIKRALSAQVIYEKVEAKDIASMPAPTKEERDKFEREQKELYADSAVRELLRKKAEDYYHNDWMKQKIPALGYKTPIEAVKTEEGRRQTEVLLLGLEKMQQAMNGEFYKVDVDGLRKKLGLL